MPRTDIAIRSLLAATDIDVLPDESIVEDRGAYVVVRTPTNENYHWGNFLLWREPPVVGDRERWEAAFDREFGADRRESQHRSFAWDTIEGERGAADEEFVAAGYAPDDAVALVAQPHELTGHPRANREVRIVELDPADGADQQRWDAVLELQVVSREPGHTEEDFRTFARSRMADRRRRFVVGDGGWFVALTPDDEIAATCGVVVTAGRGRYQAVDTAEPFRRQGIASRLVTDVGRVAIDTYGAEHLVIGADADYHATPLYESLGFSIRERNLALTWWPGAPNADKHPVLGALATPVNEG